MDQISYDDFARIDVRVGRVVQVDEFPQARKPAYKLRIDFGPVIGVKNSSAQITKYYDPNDLGGKLVLRVLNFPPPPIGPCVPAGWSPGGLPGPRRDGPV